MPITGITFALGFLALIAFPGTSGFFSKELILHAAHEKQPALFWLAVFVATLTPFYMTRLFVVAFLGKSKSDHAGHAHEVGPLMWVPLAVLALLAVTGGFLHHFAPAAPEGAGEFHLNFLFWVSLIALILGVGSAFLLYAGKDEDPLSIPLLRNRFYIDGFYDNFVVRYFQDAFAAIVHFFDELIINGLLVGGLSRLAASTGNLFRQIQSGSLQGYSFAFGLGVVMVIYFTVFL